MLRQILVGGGVSTVNIAIHALVMTILVWVARAVSAENKSQPCCILDGRYDFDRVGFDGCACG
jgi:hypothetical protein